MFHHNKRNLWTISLSIAKEIAHRGFPATAKIITATPAVKSVQRCGIVIPGRGIAVINNDLIITVASYDNSLLRTETFEYEGAEAAAENILRNLPLP